jgi:hypothetical protein
LYLTAGELEWRLKALMGDYYRFLAVSAITFQDKRFWSYHKRRLKEIRNPLQHVRLAVAILAKLLDLLLNPKRTAEDWMRSRRWASKTMLTIKGKPETAEAQLDLSGTTKDRVHNHCAQYDRDPPDRLGY